MKRKAYVIKPCRMCKGLYCDCMFCNGAGYMLPTGLNKFARRGKILIAHVVKKEKEKK